MSESEDIEIIFPEPETLEGLKNAGVIDEFIKKIKLKNLLDQLDKYEVSSIELNINGIVKSGTITSLLVSLEGSTGCKLILKPKK